jgi:molecular chaperone HscB
MPDDPFALFGLIPAFDLDLKSLEKAFLTKARNAHPDFHAANSESQNAAVEESSKLNEAYAILKSPISRAEHLLDSIGGPSSAEVRDMPPEFLMEVMELREEIEEVRESGGVDSERGRKLETKLTAEVAGVYREIESAFASAKKDSESLTAIRRSINVARYLEGLLRDLKS